MARNSGLVSERPTVAVGGVVIYDGGVVLVRRAKAPLLGEWSIPGGSLELGETLEQGLRRELREETRLEVEPLELLAVLDRIDREGPAVRFHYVIVDYLCERRGGELRARSDASEVALVRPSDLAAYQLTTEAAEVVRDGFARALTADRVR